jgi:hypothetical protein
LKKTAQSWEKTLPYKQSNRRSIQLVRKDFIAELIQKQGQE